MLQELASRVQAVQVGHPNIDNDDVWVQLQGLLDGLAAIAGFAADFPAFMLFQQGAQSAPHDFMIIG
jgi:hypothetical protein